MPNDTLDYRNWDGEKVMVYKRAKLKELFTRWCGYLKNGNSRTVYEEVLPILNDYSKKDREVPDALKSIMAACALLDAFHAGVKLEGANICQVVDELMEGTAV